MVLLKATLENIHAAARTVKEGGLVVYPTDTVYGLGCNPFDADAIEKLNEAKGHRNKPLPILAGSLKDVERVAKVSKEARKMGAELWPGPLTLVLPMIALPPVVTCGLATVGVRIPNHKVALKLINLSGGLLIGTSANKTGQPSPVTAAEAYEQLKKETVDIFLDGGASKHGVSSTVVDLSRAKPNVLRKGPLNHEDLLKYL